MALPFQWDDISGLVATAAMIGLAAWVFWLNPLSRLHRAFAWFLVFRALLLLVLRMGEVVGQFGSRMLPYFAIAVPFAAFYFGLQFRDRYLAPGTRRTPRTWFYLLVVAASTLELLYLVDHSYWGDGFTIGPLQPFLNLAYAAFAGLAFLFAYSLRNATSQPARRALFLASLGFAVEPAYQATWQTVKVVNDLVFRTPQENVEYLIPGILVGKIIWLAAIALVVASVRVVYLERRRSLGHPPDTNYHLYATVVMVAMVVAVPLAIFFSFALIEGSREAVRGLIGTHRIVDGVWTLAMPCLAAYAILRHQLFDINIKVRFVVKHGTLAAAFFAIYFVISEGLQALIEGFTDGGRWGQFSAVLGVLGAGIFVFAAHPLHRFAERISDRAVPNAKPIGQMSHPERLALYREQAELAWLDGTLERKERLILDALRVRLGISTEEGAELERAAVEGAFRDSLARPTGPAAARGPRKRAARASGEGGTPRRR